MKTFDTLPCPPNWASLVAQMVKNLPVMQKIPGQEDSPGEGIYPPKYSYLENSMDRGACWAIVGGAAKSWK